MSPQTSDKKSGTSFRVKVFFAMGGSSPLKSIFLHNSKTVRDRWNFNGVSLPNHEPIWRIDWQRHFRSVILSQPNSLRLLKFNVRIINFFRPVEHCSSAYNTLMENIRRYQLKKNLYQVLRSSKILYLYLKNSKTR